MAYDFNEDNLFAQGDRGEQYENSGWVALVNKETNRAAMDTFSHCSCDGTWDSVNLAAPVWDGTIAELVAMARENRDPSMPARIREPGDFVDHELDMLYEEIKGKLHELAAFIGPIWEKDMKFYAEVKHDEVLDAIRSGVNIPQGYEIGEIEVSATPLEQPGGFKLSARVELVEKKKKSNKKDKKR